MLASDEWSDGFVQNEYIYHVCDAAKYGYIRLFNGIGGKNVLP